MRESELRKHLIELLGGGQAHMTFDDAVKDFPVDKAGIRPSGCPHSAWELLEHIRIAQHDIATFSGLQEKPSELSTVKGNPKGYAELSWPDDYWPKAPEPTSANEWRKSVAAVKEELAEFQRMLDDPHRDLFTPFPWGSGQTLMREALLIADHNGYHVGQLLLVRRMVE